MENKAVLLSIRPKWCCKIANGEKTAEVRRSRPKIDTTFTRTRRKASAFRHGDIRRSLLKKYCISV